MEQPLSERFPRMIYHIAEKPLTVHTEEELQSYLGQGWMETAKIFSEAEQLRGKIEYHQEQLRLAKESLDRLGGKKSKEIKSEPKVEVKPPPSEEDYKFKCDFPGCDKKFTLAVALSGHRRSHFKGAIIEPNGT